ncbi:hypothetical protein BU16DRAFT_458562 [Lophium mytilinum]|uniref:Uncharacterized protein n=1 Tax=Lophium mytilinum TaxID=390894 RepID=A0A6A6QYE3_9PEZI|nr:hypothetical protein BU16DRAFT_458562 [Lophium mytilinum]
MCTEWHHRFRRCGHTRFFRWEYCKMVKKHERSPEKGTACPKYSAKYRDNQEGYNCFVCLQERAQRVTRHARHDSGTS